MTRRFALSGIVCVAFVAAALSPGHLSVLGVQNASAKTCHKGYVHAVLPWGERCLRAGERCKKVRNPEYHRYQFQCVNGKLRAQPGKRNGKP